MHSILQLVHFGKEPNISRKMNEIHFPLNTAIRKRNINKVTLLLDEGANPNETCGFTSALGAAIQEGRVEIVQALISAGCNINVGDLRGTPPLILAIKQQSLQVVKTLIQAGCDLNLKYINGDTAFLRACRDGHCDILDTLLSSNNCDMMAVNNASDTALHLSALNGHLTVVQFLLKKGFNPNVRQQCRGHVTESEVGITPLHMATHHNHADIVELLLSHGADVNACSANHRTPIHIAANKNSLHSARLLIQFNCDVNAITLEEHDFGSTALLMAVSKSDDEMVQLLLDAGSDVNVSNGHGITPIYTALFQGNMCISSLLIQHGADIDQSLPNGMSYLFTILREAKKNCSMLKVAALMLLAGVQVGQSEFETIHSLAMSHQYECRPNSCQCLAVIRCLQDFISSPLSLFNISRKTICKAIGSNLSKKSELLGMPTKLQDFLNFSDLGNGVVLDL